MLEVFSKRLPIMKTHQRRNYQHKLVDVTCYLGLIMDHIISILVHHRIIVSHVDDEQSEGEVS